MPKYFKHLCNIILCCALAIGPAAAQLNNEKPKCMTFEYADLVSIRASIKSGNNTYMAAYKSLVKTADKILTEAPEKVTDGDTPPTGDPHDFFSIGKFSWRNPNTSDGMPYIRGDGKYNPEVYGDRYDYTRLHKTVSNINTLSLAWFFTQQERYAAKAKELLRTWFIDPKTKMNPNLNCSSALPGVYNGMAAGVIFGTVFVEMTDHVQILRSSTSWDKDSDEKLKNWFSEYKNWLTTSDFGRSEKAANNNHGTWYLVQLLACDLIIGTDHGVSDLFDLAKDQLNSQVMPDGRMPREMKRVEGFDYFMYGLKGFHVLANSLKQFGYDLWSYKTPDDKSLVLPYKFIIPYITHEKQWTTGGTVSIKDTYALLMLKQASVKYDIPESKKAIEYILSETKPNNIKLLYIQ